MGSWAIFEAPSLIALIPLVIYIVMVFRGYSNTSGIMAGIFVAALIMGLDLKTIATQFQKSLGSTTAFIGLIIMAGAGLGLLMTEARITHTLVYWIIRRIGVNTQTKAKISLIICSILICGLLGTLGGGNAVISPIIIPVMASLGIVPSVVAILFKVSGEIGLILGPLTGVTLITLEVTGLSYTELMLQAALPFSIVWITGTWVAANRAQKRMEGIEAYEIEDDITDLESVTITPEEQRNTIIFLVTFIVLVAYGIMSRQGTTYALIVMILLATVIGIACRMKIDHVVSLMGKGFASQSNMFIIFVTIDVLLVFIGKGGGFEALGSLLGGLAQDNPSIVMIIASIVGGFGIEAAAVAEIKIIGEMFLESAQNTGLPMGMFGIAILAATRLTGSIYPAINMTGQLGIARAKNLKEVLQASWIGVGFVWVFVFVWAFLGFLFY